MWFLVGLDIAARDSELSFSTNMWDFRVVYQPLGEFRTPSQQVGVQTFTH